MTKPKRCADRSELCLRYGRSESYRLEVVLTAILIGFFLIVGALTDFVVMAVVLAVVLATAYLISFVGHLVAGHRSRCLAIRTFAGPIEIFQALA